MKKTDELVKKVAFFEKLAVYGNRSSFLKALGQVAGLTPDQKQRLSLVIDALGSAGPKGPEIEKQLWPFHDGASADMQRLHDLLVLASNTIPGNMPGSRIASELAAEVQSASSAQSNPSGPSTLNMPADQITAAVPISQEQQEALSRVVTVRGIGLPLKIDGKLGKETRKALDAFKKYLTEKSTVKKSYTDQEALEQAVFQAASL